MNLVQLFCIAFLLLDGPSVIFTLNIYPSCDSHTEMTQFAFLITGHVPDATIHKQTKFSERGTETFCGSWLFQGKYVNV